MKIGLHFQYKISLANPSPQHNLAFGIVTVLPLAKMQVTDTIANSSQISGSCISNPYSWIAVVLP
jgi:hypothetical protein